MKSFGIKLLTIGLIVIVGVVYAADTNKPATPKTTVTKPTAKVWRDTFQVNKKNLAPFGENTYYILKAGYKLIYKEGNTTDTLTVLNETKIIDGVEVGIIEDRTETNGQAVEITKDYFAIDTVTKDVYYFGEDVDNYKNGKLVSHDGTWISGVKGAKFGLMMPGKIKAGDKFYQEKAQKIAMDRAEIKETGLTVETPAGKFSNCIKVEDTSPLEPNVKDYKWYAPGVGLVKDNNMPLVKIEKGNN